MAATVREPVGLLHSSGDATARWMGRVAARVMGMRSTARSRGIVARDALQQERFEAIVSTFGTGYHAGLGALNQASLAQTLESVPLTLRGFAYEGAAMALVAREALNPWSCSLLTPFIAKHGGRYTYLMHVGAGWAFGWVPGAKRVFGDLDPVLRWLAYDGMGFRAYFFAGPGRGPAIAAPMSRRDPYEARAFDQGIGRCLWFSSGADVEDLIRQIAQFTPERRRDLWAGVGLAVVYAGNPSSQELAALREAARSDAPALAQGAAFAVKALDCGGQLNVRHDAACLILCGITALAAARVTDEALADLPSTGLVPAYEQWRRRIQRAFIHRSIAD